MAGWGLCSFNLFFCLRIYVYLDAYLRMILRYIYNSYLMTFEGFSKPFLRGFQSVEREVFCLEATPSPDSPQDSKDGSNS